MDILLVIDSLGSGGAQRQMVLLAKGLSRRGHAVDLFFYHPKHDFYRGQLAGEHVRFVTVEKKGRFDLNPIRRLRETMRAKRYDAAIAFLLTPGLYLVAANGLRRSPPAIVSYRRSALGGRMPWVERLVLSSAIAARAVVVNSYRGMQDVAANLPFLRSRLLVIPNGVELERFAAVPEAGARRDAPPALLFIGRLSPEKNIPALVEALSILQKRGSTVPRLLWAGRTEPGEAGQAHAAMVRKRVADLDLSSFWIELGQRDDMPAVMAQCDAVILPSVFEGMANAVCEGLAAARPILASRVGDNERLVADGRTGFLFDPSQPGDIADKIERFLSLSPEDRGAMGRAARSFAAEHLSVDAYIDNWERLIARAGSGQAPEK